MWLWCYISRVSSDQSQPYHHGKLREALLAAAETLMESRGVQGLALRELGRELGVSHSAAQRHFADRQALLDALAERGFERLGDELAAAVAHRAGFDERLRRLAHAHVGFALRHPALARWMFEARSRTGAPASLLEASDRALSPASSVLEDGQAEGEVVAGDPEHLGLVGFAAMQGLVAISADGRFNDVPLQALVDGMVNRIISGLRPRPLEHDGQLAAPLSSNTITIDR